jgi:hypothetical protein
MRKIALIVAFAATLFTVAPAAPSYAAPSHDQATGTGTLGPFGNPTAHVNAVQAKPGLKGGFTITYPDGTSATGTATCLSVNGNIGYLTGKITESGGPRQTANNWFPGNYLVIGVQDNGEPGTADKLNFSPGFATDPGCGPNGVTTPTPAFTIISGNYQIFDAP